METKNLYSEKASLIINECELVLKAIEPAEIDNLLSEIETAGKVFFVGVGRVMLSLQAISKRWNHLGIHSICVGQIDEPPITNKDLLIVGSSSGETIIPVSIAKKAHVIGARIAYIGTNSTSTVGKIANVFIHVPISSTNHNSLQVTSQQPMTSLFEQSLLLIGDTIALMIMERKRLREEDISRTHANLE